MAQFVNVQLIMLWMLLWSGLSINISIRSCWIFANSSSGWSLGALTQTSADFIYNNQNISSIKCFIKLACFINSSSTLSNMLLNDYNSDFRNITQTLPSSSFSDALTKLNVKLDLFRFAPAAACDWTRASSSTLGDILAGSFCWARGGLPL